MKAASHRKLAFCVVVAIFILAKSARANAQISASVSDGDAREHLLKQIDPVYPAIAKAAQVQGQVVLQLEIDQSGQVAKVKALSGPPMLLEAAMDAVKQWRYKPFVKDGFGVNVTTTATIPFQLATSANASEMETANKFFPLSTKCHQAVSQRADPAEEVSACQEAAVQADRFSSDTRFIERRSAYVYYATALIRARSPRRPWPSEKRLSLLCSSDTTTDRDQVQLTESLGRRRHSAGISPGRTKTSKQQRNFSEMLLILPLAMSWQKSIHRP
jgi:TonB family protein